MVLEIITPTPRASFASYVSVNITNTIQLPAVAGRAEVTD
jgi:hypothetical protein